jgi:ketosteroid isomerase-like protein
MTVTPLAVARGCLDAYVSKDRSAIEALIADDYTFTSPIDNALDRKSYFEICWPEASKLVEDFDYIYQAEDGNRAFLVYEVHMKNGKAFRCSEVHTVRNGKLIASEVYFGWDVPHSVAKGTHVENATWAPA